MYETPFTKSGKARGEIEEQCKRRTILTSMYHQVLLLFFHIFCGICKIQLKNKKFYYFIF
ncbi:hypothetical protein KUTeg_011950 [Tegillarca granosa]|uniref:DOCKER Lobe B domain-containing protein n=1 Tax=Tegillarca granosa TaxID=220873 RepID=A0ABQ9EY60_TEGGR|nr:hypothetical protein KUTeg_011950 [Tegillarca granosa]